MKELSSWLSHLVLFVTVTTLIFAVGAYLALKLKEHRKPSENKRVRPASKQGQDALLQRYVPKDKE